MYCIKCAHKVDAVPEDGICPICGEKLITDRELDEEETRTLSKGLHNRLNESRERVDDALVFIVIGTTLLIIGFLFFFLSHKVDPETFEKVVKVTCTEFWVSMAGLAGGGTLLVLGLVRFIIQKKRIQKEVMTTITCIQNNNYTHLE